MTIDLLPGPARAAVRPLVEHLTAVYAILPTDIAAEFKPEGCRLIAALVKELEAEPSAPPPPDPLPRPHNRHGGALTRLNLPESILRRLRRCGIEYIDALDAFGPARLSRIRGIGPATMAAIYHSLNAAGIRLSAWKNSEQ
jgi:hypothetical protein